MEDDFLDEVGEFVSTAWEQISDQSVRRYKGGAREGEFYFTLQFYQNAAALSLQEDDALDVYYRGETVAEGKLVREYPEYELSISCFIDRVSGKIVITAISKQEL